MVEVREMLIEQIKTCNKVLAKFANNTYRNIYGDMLDSYFSRIRTVKVEYQDENSKWIKAAFPIPYFYSEDEALLKSLMTCYLKDIIAKQKQVLKDMNYLKTTCLVKGGKKLCGIQF